MAAEQTITRWECGECGRADGGVAGGRPVRAVPHQRNDLLFAGDGGECPGMAVERHYVAADTLREWIEGQRPRPCHLRYDAASNEIWCSEHCCNERECPKRPDARTLDDLSALLDDLTTGGKTDGSAS